MGQVDKVLLEHKVVDRKSFIEFLSLLHNSYQENKADWENIDLDSFLEAMIRYSEDIQGYYDNTNQKIDADTPSWKVFADILLGAKIYE
jgi:GTPase SAR1 family protein